MTQTMRTTAVAQAVHTLRRIARGDPRQRHYAKPWIIPETTICRGLRIEHDIDTVSMPRG